MLETAPRRLKQTDQGDDPAKPPTIAVIIPTYNHARFLSDAITSVLQQTRKADEIIVVDDGSTDDPAKVVAQFPTVRMIRQDNAGLSAARNTGLESCTTSHVIFLDADDRLLPTALQAGINCFALRPDCAFVFGGYRRISEDGRTSFDRVSIIEGDAHLALLRDNIIGPPMSVLFRRDCLLAVNGFDLALKCCQDYDIYLRMVLRYPIATHSEIVFEYRRHNDNMSNNYVGMLKESLLVLDLQEARIPTSPLVRAALREGRSHFRAYYAGRMLEAAAARWRAHRELGRVLRDLAQAVRWSPYHATRRLSGAIARRLVNTLPGPVSRRVQRARGWPSRIPRGSVNFGDLKRLSPIGYSFGFDRGTPVDRYYIENFLTQNARNICGRVLEIGDNSYTLRFGGSRVSQSDILHVDATNPRATFIGDLAQPGILPDGTFDCIVLTQTIHLVYDMPAAVRALYRALRPGGVLLMTTPGISQVDRGEWGPTWYWSLTEAAARRLLEDQFGPNTMTVRTHGNVFAATAFLYALAVEELDVADLDVTDNNYPVIVTARAIKPKVA